MHHESDLAADAGAPAISRKDFLKLGGAAALGGLVLAVAAPGEAGAVTYKTVTTTPVRNGPSIRSTQVATLASGVSVNVGSQTGGSRLNSGTYANNATWCRLADGRWIHDTHLNTPGNSGRVYLEDGRGGYVTFSSTLPRTTPAILGRSTRDAVAWWAETQMGIDAYYMLCLSFCKDAWRFAGGNPTSVQRSFGTADGAWSWAQTNIPSTRRGTSGTPPRGAIVHWRYSTSGHAAISAGNGYVVSSYFSKTRGRPISWATISQVTAATGAYRGWWLPA